MFGWFKRTPPPETSKANPGQHVRVSVNFSNAERTWTEPVDVLKSMSAVLESGSYSHSVRASWIELDSGFIIQPRFLSLRPVAKGGAQTVTTVEVSHPGGIPSGIFEFQHSAGDDAGQSITKGFETWMQCDLPVFLDSMEHKPKHCTLLEFEMPGTETTGPRKRRIVLGPVAHLVTRSAEKPKDEKHPFCPCCLFTNTVAVLKQRVSDDQFYGIRFFATRNPDGAPEADCRLNGEGWQPGKAALIAYVDSWPDLGFEFRKQFVIVQNQPTI
jgi:hypothetical protein